MSVVIPLFQYSTIPLFHCTIPFHRIKTPQIVRDFCFWAQLGSQRSFSIIFNPFRTSASRALFPRKLQTWQAVLEGRSINTSFLLVREQLQPSCNIAQCQLQKEENQEKCGDKIACIHQGYLIQRTTAGPMQYFSQSLCLTTL